MEAYFEEYAKEIELAFSERYGSSINIEREQLPFGSNDSHPFLKNSILGANKIDFQFFLKIKFICHGWESNKPTILNDFLLIV